MDRGAVGLFAASSLLWGVPYVFIKVAVDAGLSPVFVATTRVVVAATVLLLLSQIATFVRRGPQDRGSGSGPGPAARSAGALQVAREHPRAVMGLALAQFALPFVLITWGEQHIDSGLTGVLVATEPLLVAALAGRLDPTQRPSRAQLAGLLVGLAGVAALLGVDVGAAPGQLAGAAAVLAAVICYAAAALSLRRLPAAVDSTALVTASMTLAAVLLLPFGAAAAPAALPTATVLGALAALALACTALAFPIWFTLIRRIGAARASLITYANPLVALILGALLLDETVTGWTLLGLALILTGTAASTGAGPLSAAARRRRRGPDDGPTEPSRRGSWSGGAGAL